MITVSCTIDMMMDMLGIPEVRNIITEKYQKSKEQIGLRNAIIYARLVTISIMHEYYFVMVMMIRQQSESDCSSETKMSVKRTSVFNRMAVLEARADKSASRTVLFFLPAMFLIFGFTLGKNMNSHISP